MFDKEIIMHNADEFENMVCDFSKTVFCLGLALEYFDNNLKPGTDIFNESFQSCLRLIDDCKGNLDTYVSDFSVFQKCLCRGSEFNSEINL